MRDNMPLKKTRWEIKKHMIIGVEYDLYIATKDEKRMEELS